MSARMQHQTDANPELDQLCINTIRTLTIDAVQQAKSGHPGLPLGAAPMAYVLGQNSCATTRVIQNGRIAIASCCRRGMAACCFIRCSI